VLQPTTLWVAVATARRSARTGATSSAPSAYWLQWKTGAPRRVMSFPAGIRIERPGRRSRRADDVRWETQRTKPRYGRGKRCRWTARSTTRGRT
jgi:hypothetical protein